VSIDITATPTYCLLLAFCVRTPLCLRPSLLDPDSVPRAWLVTIPGQRGCPHEGCVHLEFAPYLARIRCPKVLCLYPSKWPFWMRGSVHQKTLECIRFKNDTCVHPFFTVTTNQHLDPNIRIFGFYYRIFTTAIGFHYPTLVYEGVNNKTEPFLIHPVV